MMCLHGSWVSCLKATEGSTCRPPSICFEKLSWRRKKLFLIRVEGVEISMMCMGMELCIGIGATLRMRVGIGMTMMMTTMMMMTTKKMTFSLRS